MKLPYIRHRLLFIKWYFKHKLNFLNTTLIKQLRELNKSFPFDEGKQNDGQKNSKILFFAMRQDPPHLAWGSMLEIALTLRGHDVVKVSCDGFIRKACNSGAYPDLERRNCQTCKLYAKRFAKESPIFTDWLSSFSSKDDWTYAESIINDVLPKNYENFEYEGIPVGQFAKSSTIHFLKEPTIGMDNVYRGIFRDFIIGGIAMISISKRIIRQYKPEVIVMLNGWFVSERVMLEVAKQENIRVITYENGFRQNTLFFTEGGPIEYEIDSLWKVKEDVPLSASENDTLSDYLKSRENGNLGWASIELENTDLDTVRKHFNIDKDKKVAIAFSNVSWDSTLYGLDIGFENMEDWLISTIKYFSDHKEYHLIVRLHPADTISHIASRSSLLELLKEIFPVFPDNITIVPSDNKISSYQLMKLVDIGLVYTSTVGIEMSIKGIPVIVAGRPHYRNKGFTFDAKTRVEYFKLVEEKIEGDKSGANNAVRIKQARRYAYRLFFDGCLPFNKVHQTATGKLNDQVKLNLESFDELLKGKDKALDAACERIVSGVYKSIERSFSS